VVHHTAESGALGPFRDQARACRLERKELLVRVIAALGERIKELPSITGLRATVPPANKKGMAPSAATAKGFGKKK
jgi:hypothetical protein